MMTNSIDNKKAHFDFYFAFKYLDKLTNLHSESDLDMSEHIYLACNLIHSGLSLAIPEVVKYEEKDSDLDCLIKVARQANNIGISRDDLEKAVESLGNVGILDRKHYVYFDEKGKR